MTMTKNELEVFHKYVDQSEHYLEFGAGASTIYACSVQSVKSVYSVESSEQYISENLRTDPNIIYSK